MKDVRLTGLGRKFWLTGLGEGVVAPYGRGIWAALSARPYNNASMKCAYSLAREAANLSRWQAKIPHSRMVR